MVAIGPAETLPVSAQSIGAGSADIPTQSVLNDAINNQSVTPESIPQEPQKVAQFDMKAHAENLIQQNGKQWAIDTIKSAGIDVPPDASLGLLVVLLVAALFILFGLGNHGNDDWGFPKK